MYIAGEYLHKIMIDFALFSNLFQPRIISFNDSQSMSFSSANFFSILVTGYTLAMFLRLFRHTFSIALPESIHPNIWESYLLSFIANNTGYFTQKAHHVMITSRQKNSSCHLNIFASIDKSSLIMRRSWQKHETL